MALQPGMAFRWKTHSQSNGDDDATAVFEGEVFLCLASLKWGVLAWALTRESMESWRLDTNRNIEWKFILDVSDIESAEALPMLGRVRSQGCVGGLGACGQNCSSTVLNPADSCRSQNLGHRGAWHETC